MDLQRFEAALPGLYADWGRSGVRPLDDAFDKVLQQVRGMTTPGVLRLLNWAVECLGPDEAYGEIGCFQGATLVGAMLRHTGRTAYAADNFSEFDPERRNHAALLANLATFDVASSVRFSDQDFEDFLLDLRTAGVKFGAYLYDGAHDYRSQLLGLAMAVPVLARQAVLVVDDANVPAVKQATWDFLAAHPQAWMMCDLPTPGNGHPTFWNGLFVLGWDAEGNAGFDRAAARQVRQNALITSLYALQTVNVRIDGTKVHVAPA